MASLADYFTDSTATQADDARTEAGLQQSRLLTRYSTEQLPQLTNREASKGTFYSGMARTRADQLRSNTDQNVGDIQRNTNRYIADLERRRILASFGMVL